MKSRLWKAFAAALLLPVVMFGCGGSGNNDAGSGQVRLVNATNNSTALDLLANTTVVSSNVAPLTSGNYTTLPATSYSMFINNTGSATNISGSTRGVTGGVFQSLVAYTTNGALTSVFLTETEGAPTAGTAKLRVFNTSNEAGTLDVYITDSTTALSAATANAAGVIAGRFSSYAEVAKGTYRIRVTGTGDKNDLRLDLPSVTLTDQQITTLILTTTPGGVLVNGMLMNQQTTSVALPNPSARVRLVAGATGNATVAATVNGVTLSSALTSPAIGAYAMVPAGAISANVAVAGTTVPVTGLTAARGADLTLLVLGSAASPKVALLSDDNSPSVTAANAKIRLVNGANNLVGNVTLTANFGVVANDVSFATASAPASVTASDTYRLEATTPASANSLYLSTAVSLQAGKVYTLFMLGDNASLQGVLRRDR